jgi:hypothetical protein
MKTPHLFPDAGGTMRFVTTLDNDHQPATTGDAIASACLFGIVGGLIFGLAVAATIAAVFSGAFLGVIVGIVVAYQ